MALVFVLLGARGVIAQADSCVNRSIPVNVLNDQGQLVTGLTQKNFTGSMHRQPVNILSVTQDDSPRRVVIVLDASGSMTGESTAWRLYLAVARNLVTPMSAETLAGLIVFGSKIDKNIPLTSNKKQLEDELTILESGTNALPKGLRQTALWDALGTAASEFGSPQDGDAIYAITDGDDNVSKTSENSLREDLLEKLIRLFTFSVNTEPRIVEETSGSLSLMDISNATGGYAVDLQKSPTGMIPALVSRSGLVTPQGGMLMAQFRQIFSFQRLEIQLPKALDKTQEWNLKVTGTKAKDLTVVYPRKLAGCTKPAQSADATR